jgi:hypothetical protein
MPIPAGLVMSANPVVQGPVDDNMPSKCTLPNVSGGQSVSIFCLNDGPGQSSDLSGRRRLNGIATAFGPHTMNS